MKSELQMKKAIMRRVYGVYLMRQLARPMTRLTAFFAVCLAITSSVSMPNIIANALSSSDVVRFALAAVAHTSGAIQLGVLAAGLIVAWSVVDALALPSHEHALA